MRKGKKCSVWNDIPEQYRYVNVPAVMEVECEKEHF
jgi:hypothetical protein